MVGRFLSAWSFVVLTLAFPARVSSQTAESLCPPALCAPARPPKLPPLARLRQVSIVVARLSQQDKDLGLTEEELREHLTILLRKKLPELKIAESSQDYLYLKVALDVEKTVWGQRSGFVGKISLAVDRAAMNSGSGGPKEVWTKGFVISGSLREIVWNRVGSVVNRLTTLLANDWVEANP